MSKFNPDEISVSNAKILLTVLTCVALIVTSLTSNKFSSLLTTTISHCMSNALAFYSVEANSEIAKKRRANIVNIYLLSLLISFILFICYNNFGNDIISKILFFMFKVLVILISFVAPRYAIKDDDDLKSPEIKKTKQRVRKIKESKAKEKKFANRNKNVKMNQETKDFIESTDNKDTREGRRR